MIPNAIAEVHSDPNGFPIFYIPGERGMNDHNKNGMASQVPGFNNPLWVRNTVRSSGK